MAERPALYPAHEGVDPDSWFGFEERVRARRFDALIAKGYEALATGDFALAQHALAEARELKPNAPIVTRLGKQIEARRAGQPWGDVARRAAAAALLLVTGVSSLFVLERLRSSDQVAPYPVPPALITESPSPAPLLVAHAGSGDALVPFIEPVDAVTRETLGPLAASFATAERASLAVPAAPVKRLVGASLRAPNAASSSAMGKPSAASGATASTAEIRPTTVAVAQSQPLREPDTNMPGASVAVLLSDAAARVAASSDSSDAAASLTQLAVVLRSYADAYGAFDIGATRRLWPTVDERSLARAFESRALREVSFDACDINVLGAVANASCRGSASADAGPNAPRTEARTWRFDLRRDGELWKIENAEATPR